MEKGWKRKEGRKFYLPPEKKPLKFTIEIDFLFVFDIFHLRATAISEDGYNAIKSIIIIISEQFYPLNPYDEGVELLMLEEKEIAR